jgi:hypothetical protein
MIRGLRWCNVTFRPIVWINMAVLVSMNFDLDVTVFFLLYQNNQLF